MNKETLIFKVLWFASVAHSVRLDVISFDIIHVFELRHRLSIGKHVFNRNSAIIDGLGKTKYGSLYGKEF